MKKAPLRIFISRELDSVSDFNAVLQSHFDDIYPLQIIDQSCLKFSPVSFSIPKDIDAVCFYSQKGFDYFFDEVLENYDGTFKKPLIAFGIATAKHMSKKGRSPDLVGDGTPEGLSRQILGKYKGRTVLFPQALDSKNSMHPYLDKFLDYRSIVVYENHEQEVPDLGAFDAMVFTSPKNAISFAKSNSFHGKIIAIGASTAAQIIALTDEPILIAEAPYEKDLAQAVIKALNI